MWLKQFSSRGALAAKPITRPPQVVDLFAGAGGFSLGARQAGAQVTFAVEFDKLAAATYRKNLCEDGQTTLYTNDIVELNANILAKKHFRVISYAMSL